MAVSGDAERVQKAMRALEMISDTFLPVNEGVQAAAPEIFRQGKPIACEFARRMRDRWTLAEECLSKSKCTTYLRPDGGFYATLRLDERDEGEAAEAILRENHILVHPGYFYDMEADHLILSFCQESAIIRDCYPKLLRTVESLNGFGSS
jgi:aspartate/methionine/tyrosine aminotransferase